MILGVAWLATLGEVKINWKTLTIIFCRGGKQVHICGEPKLARMLVTPKALKKEKEIEAVSFVWGIENVEHSIPDQSKNNQSFADLKGSQAAELEKV